MSEHRESSKLDASSKNSIILSERKNGSPMILIAEDLAFNRIAMKHVLTVELGFYEHDLIFVEDGKKAIETVVDLTQKN
jgi:CheY-like chemotaxis protein